jgi:hypothetical protein
MKLGWDHLRTEAFSRQTCCRYCIDRPEPKGRRPSSLSQEGFVVVLLSNMKIGARLALALVFSQE